jgi:DNA mismatch endonuclease (patch repair protein)
MQSSVPKLAPRRRRAPLTRSQMMARIRSKNTRPELLTRAAVHALGQRFRTHVTTLPGNPDLANKTQQWAIFVHGCFWHSHGRCALASKPKSNAPYWTEKLRGNRKRDRRKLANLREAGFRVFVLWECQTRDSEKLNEVVTDFFSSSP